MAQSENSHRLQSAVTPTRNEIGKGGRRDGPRRVCNRSECKSKKSKAEDGAPPVRAAHGEVTQLVLQKGLLGTQRSAGS